MTPEIEVKGRSIVLRGRFNPPIFVPAWFVHFGLLPEEEIAAGGDAIVTPELSRFSADWFECIVSRDRAQFSTLTESEAELHDLVLGTFEVLASTPIHVVGLNTDVHIRAASAEHWHRLGHQLAPKERLWDDLLEQPGLMSLKIQGQRTDELRGSINVTVEPSAQIEHGVFISVNDHMDLRADSAASASTAVDGASDGHFDTTDEILTSQNAMQTLDEQWHTSLQRADTIVRRVETWLSDS